MAFSARPNFTHPDHSYGLNWWYITKALLNPIYSNTHVMGVSKVDLFKGLAIWYPSRNPIAPGFSSVAVKAL